VKIYFAYVFLGGFYMMAPATVREDYYSVLAVPKSATSGAIKKSYRKLVLRRHPDKHKESEREAATADFNWLVLLWTEML
jgi:hypothetical protein